MWTYSKSKKSSAPCKNSGFIIEAGQAYSIPVMTMKEEESSPAMMSLSLNESDSSETKVTTKRGRKKKVIENV